MQNEELRVDSLLQDIQQLNNVLSTLHENAHLTWQTEFLPYVIISTKTTPNTTFKTQDIQETFEPNLSLQVSNIQPLLFTIDGEKCHFLLIELLEKLIIVPNTAFECYISQSNTRIIDKTIPPNIATQTQDPFTILSVKQQKNEFMEQVLSKMNDAIENKPNFTFKKCTKYSSKQKVHENMNSHFN